MPFSCAYCSAFEYLENDVNLLENGQRRVGANGAVERLAVEVLHDDVRILVMLAEFKDDDDVGMLEHADGAGFAQKTLAHLGVVGEAGGHDLERDQTPENGVAGLVHHAHTAAADQFDDLVLADSCRQWHRNL